MPEITLNDAAVEAEAARLDDAEQRRIQVNATTTRYPDMTMDDAYRIQGAWQSLREGRGEQIVGHKIGLTSRAMQQAMQITTPDSGFITDAMVFEPTDVDGEIPTADIEIGRFTDARIEVELAFVLNAPLGAGTATGARVTRDDVLAATDHVVPALELIAARSYRKHPDTGYVRDVRDTISDNAANAGIIVGGRRVSPGEVDLRWTGAMLSLNGTIEETGLAAAVLGHPAEGIVWLARRYAEQGRTIEPGQIILAGSFTRPVVAEQGDLMQADYGPLGTFAVRFS